MNERTIIDAAAQHVQRSEIRDQLPDYPHMIPVLTRPGDHWAFENLERFATHPSRIRQSPKFETPEAFSSYVRDFVGTTRVFASLEGKRVLAAMDYHDPGGEASWITHVAEYPARFAPAFAAWRTAHGTQFGQRQFAEFLEDRAEDAVAPEPADLMEVAQKFEAVRNVDFKSAINISTGERQFRYEEKDAPGGAIACPKVIAIETSVFQGCPPVRWIARLSYNISDGKLSFTVKIHRLQELLEAEFEKLCSSISGNLPGVPFHRGLFD